MLEVANTVFLFLSTNMHTYRAMDCFKNKAKISYTLK